VETLVSGLGNAIEGAAKPKASAIAAGSR
jgi:hypothetical protein